MWVNTLDLRSPIGRPLAELTPSRGTLRFGDRRDEKKSSPRDKDKLPGLNGVEREGRTEDGDE